MRTLNLILAILTLAIAVPALTSTSQAAGTQRFCVIERGGWGVLQCYYYTWDQCMASASGRGSCQENPIYAAQRPPYSNTYNPLQFNPYYQPPVRVVRKRSRHRR